MARGGVLRTVTLAVGAAGLLLAVLAVTPLPAAADCCQCATPTTCGPPKSGQCAQGCQLLAGQRCNGRTGQCQAVAGAAQATSATPRRATGPAARSGRTTTQPSTGGDR